MLSLELPEVTDFGHMLTLERQRCRIRPRPRGNTHGYGVLSVPAMHFRHLYYPISSEEDNCAAP